MDQVRIGYVRYLNTCPLVEGLDRLDVLELTAAVPSKIVGLLERDDIDLGLASIVDAVRSPLELAIVPVGMIGCDGPTCTVRLFSRVPAAELTRVYVDTDSHTSAVLCQVVLHHLSGRMPTLIDFDARERYAVSGGSDDGQWPQAMLLIGDKVMTDPPPAEIYPHQLDLGQSWKDMTGMPFVYATWMCRRERLHESRVQLAAAVLDRQRRHNAQRLAWIAQRRAPEHAWPIDAAVEYLGSFLKFDIGPRELEAAEEFLRRGSELGILPHRPLRACLAEPVLRE
ncbi:MAG: hypothetical protein KF866_11495 [Phycisphaeraceae bacterium]|nr:hypothetical protein [Phycisphaeraceae bacterium]